MLTNRNMLKLTLVSSVLALSACVEETKTGGDQDINQALKDAELLNCEKICISDENNTWNSLYTEGKQFISIGFDGSYNNAVWKDTLDFAQEHDIKFTFYIVGNHLLADENRELYSPPNRKRGKSDVGFGGSVADVELRLNNIRRAYREGHELASHANGHWDGSKWTEEAWISELTQFEDFVRNAYELNGIEDPNPQEWEEIADSIIGFRAPLLAHNENMYSAMNKMGYKYDTSYGHKIGYIPHEIHEGVIGHPLAILRTKKGNTLSMDYNFYFRDKEFSQDAFDNMIDAYRGYLKKSAELDYTPMQIGHHFSRWNEGVYWSALKTFISETCNDENVTCGTNADLTKMIDKNLCENTDQKNQ